MYGCPSDPPPYNFAVLHARGGGGLRAGAHRDSDPPRPSGGFRHLNMYNKDSNPLFLSSDRGTVCTELSSYSCPRTFSNRRGVERYDRRPLPLYISRALSTPRKEDAKQGRLSKPSAISFHSHASKRSGCLPDASSDAPHSTSARQARAADIPGGHTDGSVCMPSVFPP